MSAFNTSKKLLRFARQGCGLRDIGLAFLCSGLGVMGLHRRRLRKLFVRLIGSFARSGQIRLKLNHGQQVIEIRMRRGNEADYLVAGELVAGGHALPAGKHAVPTAIVDGGANIGAFTLLAAAQFPGLPVICYEPDKANLEQLRLNLTANGISSNIVPKAMWSRTAELFFHPGMSYAGFVSEQPSPYPISCELPQVPDGCWLKLDIEGAEYEVLPALLLQSARPALISMEIHDYARNGEGLLNLLRQQGYEIYGSLKPDDFCVNVCAYKPL